MDAKQAIDLLRVVEQGLGGDPEAAHSNADRILCELLTALGFGDVVAEWQKVEKWYA